MKRTDTKLMTFVHIMRNTVLLVAALLVSSFATPLTAMGQGETCYAVASGDWADANNWSDTQGGGGGTCNASSGVPGSGDDAFIEPGTDMFISEENTPGFTITVGSVTILESVSGSGPEGGTDESLLRIYNQDDVDGSFSGNLVIEGDLEVQDGAELEVNNGPDNQGDLTVGGNITVAADGDFGGGNIRTSVNRGIALNGSVQTVNISPNIILERLETASGLTLNLGSDLGVTDLVASGNLTVNSSDTNDRTITVSGTGSSLPGSLSIGSNVEFQSHLGAGNTLTVSSSITNSGTFTVSSGEAKTESGLTNNSGATFDISGNAFTVDTFITNNGTLRTGSGGLLVAGGDFTNNDNFDAGSNSTVRFSGQQVGSGIGDQSLSGNFARNENGFVNLVVGPNGIVNPDNDLNNNDAGAVAVSGDFTVENGGVYGNSVGESSQLFYSGSAFEVNGSDAFFADEVDFNASTTISGTVFSNVLSTGPEVELLDTFEIDGNLTVGNSSTFITGTGDGELTLRGNLTVNGELDPTDETDTITGGVTFAGSEEQEIGGDTSVLVRLGNTTLVEDAIVDVVTAFERIDINNLTTEINSILDVNRPVRILGRTFSEGSLLFGDNSEITFGGSASATITLAEELSVPKIIVSKGSNTLTVSDSELDGTELDTEQLVLTEVLDLDTGNLTTNGNVTLASSSDGTAVIKYGDGEITDRINAERRMAGGSGWYMLASSGGDTYEQLLMEASGANDVFLVQGVTGSHDPPALSNLFEFSESNAAEANDRDAGFTVPGSVSGGPGIGTGFILLTYGDTDAGECQPDGEPKRCDSFPRKMEAQGNSLTFAATESLPVSYDESATTADDAERGWNLVGNPYLTNIQWDELERSNVKNAVYVWDAQNDSYLSDNGSVGDLQDGAIAPLQGFFVQADGSGPSLEIPISQAQLVEPTEDPFFSSTGPQTDRAAEIRAEMSEVVASTYTSFRSDGELGLDQSDAYNLNPLSDDGSPRIQMYTLLEDGTALNINNLPFGLDEEVSLPLVVEATGCEGSTPFSGEAALTLDETRNVPETWGVFVEDHDTGDMYDLRAEDPYTFDLESDDDCSSSNLTVDQSGPMAPEVVRHNTENGSTPDTRFTLTVDPDAGPLPVELNSFLGQVDGQAAVLEWETTSEEDNAGFYVQQQDLESEEYSDLEFVEGAGTTDEPQSYSFRVEDLTAGTHTFRLRQVDQDGSETLSDPIEVEMGLQGEYELLTFPNPVRDQATVQFAVQEAQPVVIEVYNTLGQRVRTVLDEQVEAETTREISLNVDDLASGMYIVRMRGETFSTTQKVTVVR